jgi:hypothetical protein
MRSTGGPIRVRRKANLRCDGKEQDGLYLPSDRRILLHARLTPEAEPRVERHEWAHAALDDARIDVAERVREIMALPPERVEKALQEFEEAICDAVAHATLAQWPAAG